MKQKCPYTNLKNKMKGYVNFILRPKREEFGNMPVCPFAGPELDKDKLMIDVFDPSKESFVDKMIARLVIGEFKKQNIPLDLDKSKRVINLVTKEYVNEYYGRTA